MTDRLCPVCRKNLRGMRRHAIYCSSRCRAHASRVRRLLRGETPDGYAGLDAYLAARSKRTRAAQMTPTPQPRGGS